MKKLLAVLLCLSFAAAFTACDKDTGNTQTTAAGTETESTSTSEAVSETESASESVSESETEGETAAVVVGDVVISSAEDLMAFNKAVNEDGADFSEKTIVFAADIDMTGHEWIPLDSFFLDMATFDGQGHTISNLTFADYAPEGEWTQDVGSGFVGSNQGSLTFRNLTMENVKVNAYERAVGCFIGVNVAAAGYVDFENVHVKGYTVDGWMDYNNNIFEEKHPIAFRIGGFVGHNMGGFFSFKDCSATNLTFSGFHNLAGFVGYDGTGNVDEYCFENCSVEDAKFTFSYCLSDAYTIDQPRKFVSVFYNAANKWADNLDYVVEMGNEYANVFYYDWTDKDGDNEYDADTFRSWTREEAEAAP